MALPACGAPDDHFPGHLELCTFEAFSRRVAELTPSDWAAQCADLNGNNRVV